MSDVSPILQAVYQNDKEALERLLAEEPELDVFEAAALGDTERLMQLVGEDAGATARKSPDGFTPLHLAAFFGHLDAVKILLAAGADVSIPADNDMKVLPLHSAAAASETDDRPVRRAATDIFGKTARASCAARTCTRPVSVRSAGRAPPVSSCARDSHPGRGPATSRA